MIPPISKPLVIRDEIHGDIVFDSVLQAAIDHPNFQRLRHIQQLGLASYVFPCASHTRFQHSLGSSFLAGRYLDQMVQSWEMTPFEPSAPSGNTTFFAKQTRRCIRQVFTHGKSAEFWSRVVRLAGLLHDVGHGPWSHTFETLIVAQDFKKPTAAMESVTRSFLKGLTDNHVRLHHEEITLYYLYEILHQLERDRVIENAGLYYSAIAALINKYLLDPPYRNDMEAEISARLTTHGLRGGIEMHRLVRPLISGPFDVDRIDYIQRDGRNCGVHIGGIEWGRILNQVLPCLAQHPNNSGEPNDVVLVSSAKNQHVLDDFTFSLYQMYAQVYLHPKIVGLEEAIRREIARAKNEQQSWAINLDLHRTLSDDKFEDLLSDRLGTKAIRKLLRREREATFEVKSYLSDSGIEHELALSGYEHVEVSNRPFMKDKMGVFLFNVLPGSSPAQEHRCIVNGWFEASPIAREFHSLSYSPRIWIRKRGRNQA